MKKKVQPSTYPQKQFSHWTSTNWKIWIESSAFAIQHIENRKRFTEVPQPEGGGGGDAIEMR